MVNLSINDETARKLYAAAESKAIREGDLKMFIKTRVMTAGGVAFEHEFLDRFKDALSAADQAGLLGKKGEFDPVQVLEACYEITAALGLSLSLTMMKNNLSAEATVESLVATGEKMAEAVASAVSSNILQVLSVASDGSSVQEKADKVLADHEQETAAAN